MINFYFVWREESFLTLASKNRDCLVAEAQWRQKAVDKNQEQWSKNKKERD